MMQEKSENCKKLEEQPSDLETETQPPKCQEKLQAKTLRSDTIEVPTEVVWEAAVADVKRVAEAMPIEELENYLDRAFDPHLYRLLKAELKRKRKQEKWRKLCG